ncbi:MAG: hypothetical protein HC796_08970 [Synechococcaceae cyanobacterium RL_1_2]|nr:hypothetical protein [Synechococcaceae cyanobacterium RL_1_2]
MDNQDNRSISSLNHSHFFVFGLGFSLVILANGLDGVKAESPQWAMLSGGNTSIANSSDGVKNFPGQPNWQAIAPTVEAPKEPIFTTQASPAKEPESFVPSIAVGVVIVLFPIYYPSIPLLLRAKPPRKNPKTNFFPRH